MINSVASLHFLGIEYVCIIFQVMPPGFLLNSLMPAGLPPHQLSLMKNIILQYFNKKLSQEKYLCNDPQGYY